MANTAKKRVQIYYPMNKTFPGKKKSDKTVKLAVCNTVTLSAVMYGSENYSIHFML